MRHPWKYGIAVSEPISSDYPSVLQGSIPEMIIKAKQYGFDAVELHIEEPEKVDFFEINTICKNNDLEVSAISSGLSYTQGRLSLFSKDNAIKERARKRFQNYIDLCAELNCMLILGLMNGQLLSNYTINEANDLLEEYLSEILVYAEQKEVTIVFEPINSFLTNFMNEVSSVVDYVNRLQRSNFKTLIDSYHMNIEEKSFIDPLYYAKDVLGYVHISDSNRKAPGLGHIDFQSILNTLNEINYRDYLTVECLPSPSAEEAAKHSISYLKALENAIRLREES